MNIFPNPAKDQLTIVSDGNNDYYEIYNQLGERILFGEVNNDQNTQLDISKLKPGLYFIQVSGIEGDVSSTMFIKN